MITLKVTKLIEDDLSCGKPLLSRMEAALSLRLYDRGSSHVVYIMLKANSAALSHSIILIIGLHNFQDKFILLVNFDLVIFDSVVTFVSKTLILFAPVSIQKISVCY